MSEGLSNDIAGILLCLFCIGMLCLALFGAFTIIDHTHIRIHICWVR